MSDQVEKNKIVQSSSNDVTNKNIIDSYVINTIYNNASPVPEFDQSTLCEGTDWTQINSLKNILYLHTYIHFRNPTKSRPEFIVEINIQTQFDCYTNYKYIPLFDFDIR